MEATTPWHVGEINLPVLSRIGALPLSPGRGEGLVARIITLTDLASPNHVLKGLPNFYTLKHAFDQGQGVFYSQVVGLM
jgi:hypothetical protein